MLFNLLSESANTTSPMSIVLIIVMVVVIIGLFVFSSISNKKKQKQAQEMVNSLKIGDRVKTIGGICGFVAEINDAENTFVLETGSDDKKSYVKFDKGAIYQTAPAQGNCVAAPAEEKKEDKAEEVKKEETETVAPADAEKDATDAPAEEKTEEKKAKKRSKADKDTL